jgi:hypothetical protein
MKAYFIPSDFTRIVTVIGPVAGKIPIPPLVVLIPQPSGWITLHRGLVSDWAVIQKKIASQVEEIQKTRRLFRTNSKLQGNLKSPSIPIIKRKYLPAFL